MNEKLFYYSPEKDNILNIEMTGITYRDSGYEINRAHADFHVFEYVISGSGTVIFDSEEYNVSAGDVYILLRGHSHHYFSSKDDPWEKLWFNINGTLSDNIIELYCLDRVVYKKCDAYDLFNDFIKIILSQLPTKTIRQQCSLKLNEIADFISSYTKQGFIHEADIIKTYIDNNLNKDLTLDDIANTIYKSKSQTIRIFKEKHQMTPYKYLSKQRIRAAKAFLRNTSMSIKEIADELKFADEHYFSNVFKENTGMSPKNYKNSYRARF